MRLTDSSRRTLTRAALAVPALAALVTGLRWPLELDGRAVHASVFIDRPRAEVYDFVTTPEHWPSWHPSSVAVSRGSGNSLQVGERVAETFSVAGRSGVAHWTVTVRDQPFLWIIDAQIEGSRAGGQVRYLLTTVDGGTRFDREFVYRTPNLWTYLVANTVLHGRVVDESRQALERLKQLLEQRPNLTTARSAHAEP